MAPPSSNLARTDSLVEEALVPLGPSLDEVALDRLNAALEAMSPQEILVWATNTFRGALCLQSSMQKRTSALAHMLATGGHLDGPVLFVDTGFSFAETLETRDRIETDYGLKVITVYPDLTPEAQAAQYGMDLWKGPETYRLCCKLRKEVPFVRAASAYRAVLSGLQPDEGGSRSRVRVVSYDPRIEAYVIHPLAVWSRTRLETYIQTHDLFLNPLYEKGYRSIGCSTCTTPCGPDEDERAGRWRHIREALETGDQEGGTIYCHINWVDQAPRS